jgi:hypothetical protein
MTPDHRSVNIPGVKGNNVPCKKVSGEQKILLNDLNLQLLVSTAMYLNPSTNNKIGHLSQGDTITATPALIGSFGNITMDHA